MTDRTKRIDGHIHIERGPYTLEWIQKFVDRAIEMKVDEIRLLEHNFRFEEFVPMYDSVRAYSDFVDAWFRRVGGVRKLDEYLELIELVRKQKYPVEIKFGMEVCYFPKHEQMTRELTQGKGFDFLLGSVHFAGDFAFDHTAELWEGEDVDEAFRKYFEDEILLAKSGLFDGIGHPDSIMLFGHKSSFALDDYYERLAAELAKSGMYADENSGVARRCADTATLGMNRDLLRVLKQHGVRIITSSDAHCPEDVGDKIREMEELI
ncbi:MAG: histidinol phosphate phosphatase [Lachnospiraceae bacterium]|nr:histidinol phosphate phosphatase [Lachnospiraceae bacterium]